MKENNLIEGKDIQEGGKVYSVIQLNGNWIILDTQCQEDELIEGDKILFTPSEDESGIYTYRDSAGYGMSVWDENNKPMVLSYSRCCKILSIVPVASQTPNTEEAGEVKEQKHITDFIGEYARYDIEGQLIWGIKNGKLQRLLDLRGWGAIQQLFMDKNGQLDEVRLKHATDFQDELGSWIADAINKKLASHPQPTEDKWISVERVKEQIQFYKEEVIENKILGLTESELPIRTLNRFIKSLESLL